MSLLFYTAFFGFSTYHAQILMSAGVSEQAALSIVAASRIPSILAAILVLLVIERFERRTILVTSMVVLVVGVALVGSGAGGAVALVGSMLTGLATGITAPAIYTFIVEIFPTEARATGTAIVDGVGRLGGVIAPFLFVPVLAAAGPFAIGALTVALLLVSLVVLLSAVRVRTRGRTLEEIAPQPPGR